MRDFSITVQNKSVIKSRPSGAQIKDWAQQTLEFCNIQSVEITFRLVDEIESATLNQIYRHKTGPTNVLSFPYEHFTNEQTLCVADNEKLCIMGDIVICVPVVIQEALVQEKPRAAHFAHMVVHAVLHLLGYDHETDAEALIMEPLENKLLIQLGFKAPYGESISL